VDRTRVILVEDSRKYAALLSKRLEASGGIVLAAVFASAEELLDGLNGVRADVALIDIGLPGMDGIELTRRLRSLGCGFEIIMLTAFEDEERLFSALRAGASGYLTKQAPAEKVAEAIRSTLGGGTVISPALARRFCNHFASLGAPAEPNEDPWGLSARERDLLEIVAKGLTNTETGLALGLGRRTVRTILGHIYGKMGVSSRVEAVSAAIRAGLLKPGG
jgi:DNA-binding NarL/FixJ family response regulator